MDGCAQPIGSEPEFCPNRWCRYHSREVAAEYQWYIRYGRFHTRARGWIQRFRCTRCGKCCSTQTFSVHYWTHTTNDMVWLLQQLCGCNGQRSSGRFAGVTHRVIQNRLRRLARNCLAVMDLVIAGLELREDLAMDGFESFTRSKYHPNNITHLVGNDSQFLYAAVHTSLRRKGSMSHWQRRRRALLDSVWKPATRVREDCATVLADLSEPIATACTARGKLRLATDEHPVYRPALRSVPRLAEQMQAGRLEHLQVSSRAMRTVANPLFPVNYVDRQLRMSLAEYVRHSIRHAREVNCQMERLSVFMVVHNFLTPHRVGDQARADQSPSHAQIASIEGAALTRQLARIVTHRHVWSHNRAAQQWIRRIWQHEYPNPPAVRLRKGVPNVRSVALAPRMLPAHLLA